MSFCKSKSIVFSIAAGSLLLVGLLMFLQGSAQGVRADPINLFVAPAAGGDCSQANPCSLHSALSSANDGDVLYLAQGTYTGNGTAVITVTRSITIYGGWDGMPMGAVLRDPAFYPSMLDGEKQRRGVYINANTSPVIDGLIIAGGNATGLGGGLFTDSEAGGGIYSKDATPIIQNNIITNNIASTLPDVRALGGGIYIESDTTSAIIRYNQVLSNTAGNGIHQGDGGGLNIIGAGSILNNVFRDNTACINCDRPMGGGAYIGWTTSEIVVAHNRFENNHARYGGGLYLVWSAVQVNHNTIIGNTSDANGAGLYSHYDRGSYIYANQIFSNTATSRGGGIGIYITQDPGPTQIFNNIIAENQAGSAGGGFYAYSDWNISAVTLTHNTLASNGVGIEVGDHMTATLINNIVADHTVGVTTTFGNVFAEYTLFWENVDDGIRGTNPVDADPFFVDPIEGNYHIGLDSGAIDQGVDSGLVSDIDGDLRPAGLGYDLGADEFWYKIFLPLIFR